MSLNFTSHSFDTNSCTKYSPGWTSGCVLPKSSTTLNPHEHEDHTATHHTTQTNTAMQCSSSSTQHSFIVSGRQHYQPSATPRCSATCGSVSHRALAQGSPRKEYWGPRAIHPATSHTPGASNTKIIWREKVQCYSSSCTSPQRLSGGGSAVPRGYVQQQQQQHVC